ncbi:MAG: hypothetical protein ACLS8D_00610 [Clostridioides difficile]
MLDMLREYEIKYNGLLGAMVERICYVVIWFYIERRGGGFIGWLLFAYTGITVWYHSNHCVLSCVCSVKDNKIR